MNHQIKNILWVFILWLSLPFAIQAQDQPVKYRLENPVSVQYLKLENLTHPDFTISVISLFPAPLKLDKQMEGLKRLELRISAWTIKSGRTLISVRLFQN